MPKPKYKFRPRTHPGQTVHRYLHVRVTEEHFRRLRLIRAYCGNQTPSDLMRATIDRLYEEIVVPQLNGNGNGNGHHTKGTEVGKCRSTR
jgi:hypothetical protein